jgi:acyl-CoA synthetase (AMP-forming)/AMP-acid ligase II
VTGVQTCALPISTELPVLWGCQTFWLHKEKYLYFKSRVKNTIRRSGITIYPEDIEKAFINDKNIKEVAAIGKELKRKTLIFLFIIKKKDIEESYIRTVCLKKLSTFQFPNKIIFLK